MPLVVSEVNPEQVANRPRGIIANPNCSTMQMLVALAPLHRKYGIERINVSTYQSVSGGGRSATEELGKQTGQLLSFQEIDRGRHPGRLHAGQPQRTADGHGTDRQRSPRIVRAPDHAAHDQHLHACRPARSITRIGRIMEGQGVHTEGHDGPSGYEHFTG